MCVCVELGQEEIANYLLALHSSTYRLLRFDVPLRSELSSSLAEEGVESFPPFLSPDAPSAASAPLAWAFLSGEVRGGGAFLLPSEADSSIGVMVGL